MAFLSIHTMEGDPDDLLARKRQHMDPVAEQLGPAFGALAQRRATGLRCAHETDFRHAGLASTGPYGMNASFTRLARHERGIHVV